MYNSLTLFELIKCPESPFDGIPVPYDLREDELGHSVDEREQDKRVAQRVKEGKFSTGLIENYNCFIMDTTRTWRYNTLAEEEQIPIQQGIQMSIGWDNSNFLKCVQEEIYRSSADEEKAFSDLLQYYTIISDDIFYWKGNSFDYEVELIKCMESHYLNPQPETKYEANSNIINGKEIAKDMEQYSHIYMSPLFHCLMGFRLLIIWKEAYKKGYIPVTDKEFNEKTKEYEEVLDTKLSHYIRNDT